MCIFCKSLPGAISFTKESYLLCFWQGLQPFSSIPVQFWNSWEVFREEGKQVSCQVWPDSEKVAFLGSTRQSGCCTSLLRESDEGACSLSQCLFSSDVKWMCLCIICVIWKPKSKKCSYSVCCVRALSKAEHPQQAHRSFAFSSVQEMLQRRQVTNKKILNFINYIVGGST